MSSLIDKDSARPEPRQRVSFVCNRSDLGDFSKFRRFFVYSFQLGSGGDGRVDAFEHKPSGKLIAVKTSTVNPPTINPPTKTNTQFKPCKALIQEIENFKILGDHPHIVSMVAYSTNFQPRAPAIFLTVCELGDLNRYKHHLCVSQLKAGNTTSRVPENTIWKLIHDMSLVLDHMHNRHSHGNGYMHGDIKPGNILARYPSGWKQDDGLPLEPVFQLTDFTRMQAYPPVPHQHITFVGTPEFAPPHREQEALRPSGDMWSLGATVQALALGIAPTQSWESFAAARAQAGQDHPPLGAAREWKTPVWRTLLPAIFRPLSASREELKDEFDFRDSLCIAPHLKEEHEPYSRSLDAWYSALWEPKACLRISADSLATYLAPRCETEMQIASDVEAARRCFDRARKLRQGVVVQSG